ncbi:MAG: hypothetical protein M1827_001281 [Pycnora praestabilis]|nr:MAG: hypothetical protein M1827_001281 [Pycnora praestabilis]
MKIKEDNEAQLPVSVSLEDLKAETLECPEAKWLVGWSCGKETLKDGRYDTLKGSYYINCAPTDDGSPNNSLAERYPSFPEYTAANIWPSQEQLPGFRETVRELCNLIIEMAVLVASACDRYAEKHIEGYKTGYLEHVVKTSTTSKARLLHYFPPRSSSSDLLPTNSGLNGRREESQDDNTNDEDDWCATHVDHGCLTGLTSAMFIDETASPPDLPSPSPSASAPPTLPELPSSPDPTVGLYIHSRSGTIVKVSIPRDCLAFQTGEALEIITKGRFRAVPHFVKGGKEVGGRVARNTLAVFTQPNLWEKIDERDFAGFARGVVERNH